VRRGEKVYFNCSTWNNFYKKVFFACNITGFVVKIPKYSLEKNGGVKTPPYRTNYFSCQRKPRIPNINCEGALK